MAGGGSGGVAGQRRGHGAGPRRGVTCVGAAPPGTTKRASGIPLEPVLVGWLETSVVVAQKLIKSTTSVWIGMGPGAGRVDNDRLWSYHALSWSALDHPWRPKPNYQRTTLSCIVVEL